MSKKKGIFQKFGENFMLIWRLLGVKKPVTNWDDSCKSISNWNWPHWSQSSWFRRHFDADTDRRTLWSLDGASYYIEVVKNQDSCSSRRGSPHLLSIDNCQSSPLYNHRPGRWVYRNFEDFHENPIPRQSWNLTRRRGCISLSEMNWESFLGLWLLIVSSLVDEARVFGDANYRLIRLSVRPRVHPNPPYFRESRQRGRLVFWYIPVCWVCSKESRWFHDPGTEAMLPLILTNKSHEV